MLRIFVAAAVLFWASAATAHPAPDTKRVALTFDDIPRQAGAFFTPDERTDRLIAALDEAGVEQAAFFVNPGRLATTDGAGGEARISAYVEAGHVLANHSFSHPHLNTTSAEDYLADIDRASAWLEGRPGTRPWFRLPYLDEGGSDKAKRDAVRGGLAERGLMNGYVTVQPPLSPIWMSLWMMDRVFETRVVRSDD
ncbi:polysaccharide deacetylase family protein [Sphingomicrobium sp. XHP0235]|uniref:polysaccharide deacetylase family protein n=1 Tax=Sphingomicrobium aquimarinum TaxID=3133971 RepID=UPI0031FF3CCC